MVVGEVPVPDPSDKHRPFRDGSSGADKNETEAKSTVFKIIGYLKKSEK
jgi:hypothetical protein